MFVGPYDVRDLHGRVVDDAGEIIERRAVRANDDEVADLVGLEFDVALDGVVKDERSSGRDLEAQGKRLALGLGACGFVARHGLAAESIGAFLALGGFLIGGAFTIGTVVAINVARGEQSFGGLPVAFRPLGLIIWSKWPAYLGALVPVDSDPPKAVENVLDRIVDMPLLVGVVDPQDKLAAVVSRQEPVE